MNTDNNVKFFSSTGKMMEKFIQEKRSCGYKYEREVHLLKRLDYYLCNINLEPNTLPKPIVDSWIKKREYEQIETQNLRIIMIRQLSIFLNKYGYDAYVPNIVSRRNKYQNYVPYIFNRREIKKLLLNVDCLAQDNRSPNRHIIMPEIFRLLYCCGMRVNEVLHLKVSDVDLVDGILIIYETKFNKDRLIPMSPSMTKRLRKYSLLLNKSNSDEYFFQPPTGGSYSNVTVYNIFRQLLCKCSISHGGRGKGPRLHDFRHSFAVHQLENWYKNDANLDNKLSILATYMGHRNLIGTQKYLHLTPDIFSDINKKIEKYAGTVIPGGLRP